MNTLILLIWAYTVSMLGKPWEKWLVRVGAYAKYQLTCTLWSDILLFVSILYFTLNPFMPSGLSFLRSLDRSNSYIRGVLWHLILVYIFCRCPFYGMPGIWDARHKWVKSAKQNCCSHFKTVLFLKENKVWHFIWIMKCHLIWKKKKTFKSGQWRLWPDSKS